MPAWLPLSRFGAVIAFAYLVFAIWVLVDERKGPAGDWISLKGMATYIVTLPVSAPFELLGARLDFKRNLDMGFAIALCAALVYLVGAGLGWIGAQIVQAFRA